jgi:transcriptional regulator with XRE-family HTH domain
VSVAPKKEAVGGLGEVLFKARTDKGWSLRQAEERSGIHNAHISQIEKGVISRPSPTVLNSLAQAYDLDFTVLMQLAGIADSDDSATLGAALNALHRLSPDRQREALAFIYRLHDADRRPRQ